MLNYLKLTSLFFAAALFTTNAFAEVLATLDTQKSTHKLLKVTTAELRLTETGQKTIDFEFVMPISESISGISIYTDFSKREKIKISKEEVRLFRSAQLTVSRKAVFADGKYVTTKVRMLVGEDDRGSYGLTVHSQTGDVSLVFNTKTKQNARYGRDYSANNGLSCTCYGGPGNYPYQCAPIQKTCYGGPGMYPYQCNVCP